MRKSSTKTKQGGKKPSASVDSEVGDKLDDYRRKRDPTETTEPFGAERIARGEMSTPGGQFVVHLHDATRRHYDMRLQIGTSLRSFAVPKGPSLDPSEKRLAIETENHPLEYVDFEDVIPEGNYGAGAMIVWDVGRVTYLEGSAEDGVRRGKKKQKFLCDFK